VDDDDDANAVTDAMASTTLLSAVRLAQSKLTCSVRVVMATSFSARAATNALALMLVASSTASARAPWTAAAVMTRSPLTNTPASTQMFTDPSPTLRHGDAPAAAAAAARAENPNTAAWLCTALAPTPAAIVALPVALLPEPPTTALNIPEAVLERPPPTAECVPAATLSRPPATTADALAAKLDAPPPMKQPTPLGPTTLSSPPATTLVLAPA
jgi:hypothetical protein